LNEVFFTEFDVFSESGESFVELGVMVLVIPNNGIFFHLKKNLFKIKLF
jgi:hypothetical protein